MKMNSLKEKRIHLRRAAMTLLVMVLTTMTAWAQGVDYIDANGVVKNTATDDIVGNDNPTVLTGGGATTLSAGWYVVNSDITYTGDSFSGLVTLRGDVTIILCNGKTMNIGTSTSEGRVSGSGIYGSGHNLTIYGQTLDEGTAGQLRIYMSSSYSNDAGILIFPGTYTQHSGNVTINSFSNNAINVYGDITINGGKLDATATAEQWNSNDVIALACSNNINMNGGILNATGITSRSSYSANGIHGAVTMTGGTLTASGTAEVKKSIGIEGAVTFSGGTLTASATSSTGSTTGISGNVSLSWTSPTDRFTASSYDGTVTIADGQAFTTDGTDIYRGTLSSDVKAAIKGKTLVPYGMTVAAKEATVGGQTNYWTTLYRGDAGFAIDAEENACAYTATVSGTEITLHRLGKVIPKGTAVIIVGADESIGMTTTNAEAEYTVDNDLHGVDVATALSSVKTSLGADAILVLSNKNGNFGFHELATTNVPARKAFLAINDPTGVREFTMVFEDATEIRSIDNGELTTDNLAGAWYSLDGRRLSGKPTKSGIYVKNGHKVIIK